MSCLTLVMLLQSKGSWVMIPRQLLHPPLRQDVLSISCSVIHVSDVLFVKNRLDLLELNIDPNSIKI